jgi:carboxyl-terminal processing protease
MAIPRRAILRIAAARLLAAGAGLGALGGCDGPPWARQSEQVFHQVRRLIEAHHYSRDRDTPAWRTWRADAEANRRRAAGAGSVPGLYFDVLVPMVAVFGDSHTFATPPALPAAKPAAAAWRGDIQSGQGFDFDNRGLTVARVAKGSLADRHEIEPGSRILAYRLDPRPGRSPWMTLRLEQPDGSILNVEYGLDEVAPDPPFEARRLPSGRSLVRLDRFDTALAAQCIGALHAAPAAGLVLDLRRDAGGEERACRDVMGVLLGADQPIATLVEGARRTPWTTASGTAPISAPMAVLIGPATASAAEVVAANLQERGRAILVGGPTAGAVLQASVFPLLDGGSLSIAERDVLTPAGRRLEGVGVQPDRQAHQTLAAIRQGRDLVVEAAEAALSAGSA